MSPAKKRHAVQNAVEHLEVSEQRGCQVLEQPRPTQRSMVTLDAATERLIDRRSSTPAWADVMGTGE